MQNKNVNETEKLFQRFRNVLREALHTGKVTLPNDIEINYSPMLLYRAVRISDNKKTIDDSDFMSQMEKGQHGADDSVIENYSCSFFTCIAPLKDAMKLPRKNKKIAKGYVKKVHGARKALSHFEHVHLFRYKDVEIANEFEVISDEEMDTSK